MMCNYFPPSHGLPFHSIMSLIHKSFHSEEVQFAYFVVITYGNANSSAMKLSQIFFEKKKFYLLSLGL